MTAAFDPASVSGTSSTLTVTVGVAVPTGLYHLSVHGTGTPGTRSTPLDLTVGGGTSITLDVSGCDPDLRPSWLAYQDGNGPWVVSTPVGNVYHFTVSGTKGGLAYWLSASNVTLVNYRAVSELNSGSFVICPVPSSTNKTIHGTVSGLTFGQEAYIGLGGGGSFASSASPSFAIGSVADGAHDLVAYSHRDSYDSEDRLIIRRDLNLADGDTLDPIKFDSTEAYPLVETAIPVIGLTGSELGVNWFETYNTGSSCDRSNLIDANFTSDHTMFDELVPAALQRVTDLYGLVLSTDEGTSSRFAVQYYHDLSGKSLTLGAALPTPTVTTLAGPYKRLQLALTLPADYNLLTDFRYQGGSSTVEIDASAAYFGSSTVSLSLPDFSALAGWSNSWAPGSAETGTWNVSATGGTSLTATCVEGGHLVQVQQGGTF